MGQHCGLCGPKPKRALARRRAMAWQNSPKVGRGRSANQPSAALNIYVRRAIGTSRRSPGSSCSTPNGLRRSSPLHSGRGSWLQSCRIREYRGYGAHLGIPKVVSVRLAYHAQKMVVYAFPGQVVNIFRNWPEPSALVFPGALALIARTARVSPAMARSFAATFPTEGAARRMISFVFFPLTQLKCSFTSSFRNSR